MPERLLSQIAVIGNLRPIDSNQSKPTFTIIG
jgi:hypothetical protein